MARLSGEQAVWDQDNVHMLLIMCFTVVEAGGKSSPWHIVICVLPYADSFQQTAAEQLTCGRCQKVASALSHQPTHRRHHLLAAASSSDLSGCCFLNSII